MMMTEDGSIPTTCEPTANRMKIAPTAATKEKRGKSTCNPRPSRVAAAARQARATAHAIITMPMKLGKNAGD